LKHKEEIKKERARYYNKNKKEILRKNAIRQQARENIKKVECQFCKSKEKLEYHHLKYELDTKEIIILCRKCHVNTHKKEKGLI
jgi:5-formyltetrahydrofolate cyclo-ligase